MSEPTIRKTQKQHEMMEIILSAADKGEFLSCRSLYRRVSYKDAASYQAILCSIKYLERAGMIRPEKSGRVKLLKPTSEAYAHFRSGA